MISVADATVHGLLYVPGAGGVNAEAARRGSCVGCVWAVVEVCYESGLTGPNTMHCQGTSVGCAPAQRRYQVFLTTPAEAQRLVDSFCRGDLADIVTADTLNVDAERYIKDVTVPTTGVRIQPRGPSVVTIPTYFEAVGDQSAGGNFGPAGLTISISVRPATYTWDFGDGTRVTTTSRGGPYPSGDLRHTYTKKGHFTGSLTTTWQASATLNTPGGTLGPVAIDTPVTPVAQPFTVVVKEARSELVSR